LLKPFDTARTSSTIRPPSSSAGTRRYRGVLVDAHLRLGASGKFPELTGLTPDFTDDFQEESTVAAFLLRARREGLRDFALA